MELNAPLHTPLPQSAGTRPPALPVRRRLFAFLAVLLAAVAIACSSSDSDDTASEAPAPSATPQTPEATAAPTEGTSPATPTTEPAASPTPEPTDVPPSPSPEPSPTQSAPTATVAAGPQPVTVNISAMNIVYSTAAISVPANTQVTVVFNNTDTSVPHDFGVTIPGVAHTDICNGPCTDSITFNSGSAATYQFQCSVHPEMLGTFTVQ